MPREAKLLYRQATLDEIYQLRFAVLRPGQSVVKLYFPGDELAAPNTWHFGAFLTEIPADPIACLTLFASTWEGHPALQLRGMAVADAWRSHGTGTQLLRAAAHALSTTAAGRLPWWCNARVPAIKFYQNNHWQIMSEKFEIPGVGPHRKMLRIAPSTAGVPAPLSGK